MANLTTCMCLYIFYSLGGELALLWGRLGGGEGRRGEGRGRKEGERKGGGGGGWGGEGEEEEEGERVLNSLNP